MTRFINGQEFTCIEYSNRGAHAPIQTWYPTEGIAELRKVCDVKIVK